MRYGLIGKTLKHSFSKEIHEKFGYDYTLKELAPTEVSDFLKEKAFLAVNVTIPYKEVVIPYLYQAEDAVEKIGACNTVVNRDGQLYGYNTDVYGMRTLLLRRGISPKGKCALVLGSGGTSKTAEYTLYSLGAENVYRVSRNEKDGCITYEKAKEIGEQIDILVNTTPVGMFPNENACPVDLAWFPNLSYVADVIYNPLRTRLIRSAQNLRIPCAGGLCMLVSQAVYASFLFRDVMPQNGDEIYRNLLREKQNIVFVGEDVSLYHEISGVLSKPISTACEQNGVLIPASKSDFLNDSAVYLQNGVVVSEKKNCSFADITYTKTDSVSDILKHIKEEYSHYEDPCN